MVQFKYLIIHTRQFVDISTQTSYTQSGLNNKTIALLNPFRYRSYYYDEETGLYYLNSRYYDPQIGRFINADNISTLDVTQIALNGLNLYAYCLNNPVNETDEDGNMAWWLKLLLGITFIVVGAFITALTAGTGTGFWAAFGSALLTSTIQTGISTAISAGIGFLVGGISSTINGGSFWDGAWNGFLSGTVDGFMWGGVFSGSSQILSGAMRIARNIHGPGKMGINLFNGKLRLLSPDKAHFAIPGGTLIKFGKFSLDTGRYALHLHLEIGKLADKHIMVIPFITSMIELFKRRK